MKQTTKDVIKAFSDEIDDFDTVYKLQMRDTLRVLVNELTNIDLHRKFIDAKESNEDSSIEFRMLDYNDGFDIIKSFGTSITSFHFINCSVSSDTPDPSQLRMLNKIYSHSDVVSIISEMSQNQTMVDRVTSMCSLNGAFLKVIVEVCDEVQVEYDKSQEVSDA